MRILETLLSIIGWGLAAVVLWAIFPLLIKLLTLANRLHNTWL